jgi:hypothetical protein
VSRKASHVIASQDVREAAEHCVASLEPHAAADWAASVPGLAWNVRITAEHLVDLLGFYTLHLAAGSLKPLRLDVRCHDGLPNEELLAIVISEAHALATVAELVGPDARAFHFHGATDPSGFVALAVSELLVHSHDLARAFGGTLQPRGDLAARVLARLFPTAPADTDPWATLLWATGRGSLPGFADVGDDWRYRPAPLQ